MFEKNSIYCGKSSCDQIMYTPMQNCKIHHSVVGLRSCISEGAVIEDTLLMGADYYEVIPDKKVFNLFFSLSLKW